MTCFISRLASVFYINVMLITISWIYIILSHWQNYKQIVLLEHMFDIAALHSKWRSWSFIGGRKQWRRYQLGQIFFVGKESFLFYIIKKVRLYALIEFCVVKRNNIALSFFADVVVKQRFYAYIIMNGMFVRIED